MQVEQNLPTALDNRMQRPRVAPAIEAWCDLDVVEGRGDVSDDPEDEEETHPWLSDDHGHLEEVSACRYVLFEKGNCLTFSQARPRAIMPQKLSIQYTTNVPVPYEMGLPDMRLTC
jgi:hypothetical protein